MKLHDRETVEGTTVTIGRRIQYRTVNGERVEKVSKTYTAVYLDLDGNRRHESLGTLNRREARLRAKAIQSRLTDGSETSPPSTRLTIAELIDGYMTFNEHKGLTLRSLTTYRGEMAKFLTFCNEAGISRACSFGEQEFVRYGSWLRSRTHKQGQGYAPKSVHHAMVCVKQLFKWGWRNKYLPAFTLDAVPAPSGAPRRQPCFTTEQVESMRARTTGELHAAITILAYAGLRVGELQHLCWSDIRVDQGDLGMLHITKGGSAGTTKDKDHRFIPIHPEIADTLKRLPRSHELVLPGLKQRTLLTQVKRLCVELGFGSNYKVHSFRHHFASMVASSNAPYRVALEWMGHSSSTILNHYFTLHDSESQAAMKAIAAQTSARLGR
ncbi:MAG: site-specific integrase [Phycisphaerales bacterium]